MMGLSQLNFAGENRVEVAIDRIQSFEPAEGYYLAFSGGKDSIVLYDLAVRAGVRFDAHFEVTTVDPPELLAFIMKNYPGVTWDRPVRNMYRLIVEDGFPTRVHRSCCDEFKEVGGIGRLVLTGIRWSESPRRKNRKMTEACTKYRGKKYLHPIIDWSAQDVWQYIKSRHLLYCSLYDEGYDRIGCVLCPMQSPAKVQRDLIRFPKIARAYRLAFEKLWQRRESEKNEAIKRWANSEEMWQWWLTRKGTRNTDQETMFD